MVTLVVLDGFGIGTGGAGDATANAKIPNLKRLFHHASCSKLLASGSDVGIERGQMGNSECGHINMGAGRIVKQNSVRLDEMFENNDHLQNKALLGAINHAKKNNSSFHIMGLYSQGGVHSKISHAKSIIKMAQDSGIKNIFVHVFTDGRDRPTTEAKSEILSLNNWLDSAKIASICGRVWAMDRENRWDRISSAYNTLTHLGDYKSITNIEKYFDDNYKNGITDEFLPAVAIKGSKPISDGDSVVFFNFRTDRPKELTQAFTQDEFECFKREKLNNLYFATLTNYGKDIKNVNVVLENEPQMPSLGQILAEHGKKQFRISESTKYAHVTYFFNGEIESPFEGETRVLLPTEDVLSFDQNPKMRAYEITDQLCQAIKSQKFDFLLANLTNCDMVGHTGNFRAAVEAVEAVDECVGKICDVASSNGCDLIITADHGNIENMILPNGEQNTAHTTSPVPLFFIAKDGTKPKLKQNMPISCIAPTVLTLLKIEPPKYMTTPTFFEK